MIDQRAGRLAMLPGPLHHPFIADIAKESVRVLKVTKEDREILPLVLWAIDPFDERSYIPEDKAIWVFGWFALVWNIAGGRKRPLVWSDLWSRLPFRLITYPTIRWVGTRLRPTQYPIA